MANEDTLLRTRDATEETALLPQAKRDERAHVASARAEVAASGTFNMHLRNPTANDRNANVQTMFVRSQFEGVVDVYDTFTTAPSGGTTVNIDNLLMDTAQDNGDGSMALATDVSYSGDNTHVEDVLPGGGAGGHIGGMGMTTSPLIEPDREIVVEVTNQSSSADDAVITIVYVEEAQ